VIPLAAECSARKGIDSRVSNKREHVDGTDSKRAGAVCLCLDLVG
jgi:hypothetical protein